MIAFATRPKLTFRTGPREGERRALGRSLRIGRGGDSDLVMEDASLSRRHCTFYTHGAKTYIEDLDSTNGTRVNGETVLIRRALREGDVVTVGTSEIQYTETGA